MHRDDCKKLAGELALECGAGLVLECATWPKQISLDAMAGFIDMGMIRVRVGNAERRYLEWNATLYAERSMHFPDGYEEYRMRGSEKYVVTTPGREVWYAGSTVELDGLRERAWALHDAEGR